MPPEGVSLLDKRLSPLNPLWNVQTQERRSFTYGHFPLYLLVLTANVFHELAPLAERLGASPELVETLRTANGVPGFAVVGRLLMAIADTFTVLFVYLLAERTYRRRGQRHAHWVGLLAAAFSAFTVLQIQLSHFFAVDPISTTFTAMALYGALRMAEGREGEGERGREGEGERGREGTEGNLEELARTSSGRSPDRASHGVDSSGRSPDRTSQRAAWAGRSLRASAPAWPLPPSSAPCPSWPRPWPQAFFFGGISAATPFR